MSVERSASRSPKLEIGRDKKTKAHMYDTATRAQFIDLRARGWSYEKITRHTGINKNTLVKWGREYQKDIETLKADYISPRVAFPDGTAQESYFHNLEGEGESTTKTQSREERSEQVSRRESGPVRSREGVRAKRPKGPKRRKESNRLKAGLRTVRTKFRKLMRSPVVRAAIRYAVVKH